MFLLIGIGVIAWIGACLLLVALCASAKQGDGADATLVPGVALEPRGPLRRRRAAARRRAPALS